MTLMVKDVARETEEFSRWVRNLVEKPEGVVFYYGLPEYPPIEISAKEDAVIIRAEIPGMSLESFDITLTGNNLKISGTKKTNVEGKRTCMHCMERPAGEFNRLIYIPRDLDPDNVKASYKHGILTITLVRKEEMKPRHIEIGS